MEKFKIGQRVRITGPATFHGCAATIYDILRPTTFMDRILGLQGVRWARSCVEKYGVHPREIAYLVDVDGHGRHADFFGSNIGFPSYWLRPLDEPKADAWAEEAVRKVTKPQHVEPVAPKILTKEAH